MPKATRAFRHRRARGFTLLELMVVVILISLLAALAAPAMTRARNDRITFDYARQTSEMMHAARSRAVGRGAAHLLVYRSDFGARGALTLFEALDGTAPPAGPNPMASCRGANFGYVTTWTPGAAADAANAAALVDAINLNATPSSSVQVLEDMQMLAYTMADDGTKTAVPSLAMCITPNGTTYVGTGTTVANAVNGVATATPFTGIVEIDVARHDGSGGIIGLNRRVIAASSAQPRIKSE